MFSASSRAPRSYDDRYASCIGDMLGVVREIVSPAVVAVENRRRVPLHIEIELLEKGVVVEGFFASLRHGRDFSLAGGERDGLLLLAAPSKHCAAAREQSAGDGVLDSPVGVGVASERRLVGFVS